MLTFLCLNIIAVALDKAISKFHRKKNILITNQLLSYTFDVAI